MRKSVQLLGQLFATLHTRPDRAMQEWGSDGELTVARIRALLSLLLLLLPLINAWNGGAITETLIGLIAAIIANLAAQIWLLLALRPRALPWLPYATGSYDVLATTAVLALLSMRDPAAGLNSMVVWSLYLFSIAMTALRNDGRLTFYVGMLAVAAYGLLAWLVHRLVRDPERLVSLDYGTVSASTVIERIVLLGMMTLLTASIVQRAQRLVESSGKDPLTGMLNRAWLMQRAPQLLEAGRGEPLPLSLALLRIDGFKRLHEDRSHAEAERALRRAAATLRRMLQDDEYAVRMDEHEFVLLLRAPIGNAWERVDRCRRALAQAERVGESANHRAPLALSGGLAAYPQDGMDVSALLDAADRRLRQAKAAGGNRLVTRDW